MMEKVRKGIGVMKSILSVIVNIKYKQFRAQNFSPVNITAEFLLLLESPWHVPYIGLIFPNNFQDLFRLFPLINTHTHTYIHTHTPAQTLAHTHTNAHKL